MIAITIGDPNGIGPEVLLKAHRQGALEGKYVAVGDQSVLKYCAARLDLDQELRVIGSPAEHEDGALNVISLGLMSAEDITPGRVDKKAGAASIAYVRKAAQMALDGMVDCLVTLPVNKQAVQLSYPRFSGHTELIAEMCGQSEYTMMLSSPRLRVTHVTTHVSMADAIRIISRDRVLSVITLTHEALRSFIEIPRIAVAGLNCHAGEHGLFGREEIERIAPAVEAARAAGMECSGPYPPDTIFLRASRGEFDAVVCMYHDQGHIPVKLLGFDEGVNVTLGLRIKRTSVDHGTAFDIAYQGVASPRSLIEAYMLARKLTTRQELEKRAG